MKTVICASPFLRGLAVAKTVGGLKQWRQRVSAASALSPDDGLVWAGLW